MNYINLLYDKWFTSYSTREVTYNIHVSGSLFESTLRKREPTISKLVVFEFGVRALVNKAP